jgi:DNA-binding CsgD family transcriptional regulator
LNASISLSHLGDLSVRHGEIAAAVGYLTRALDAASRSGKSRAIALSLCRLVQLAIRVRQPEVAARLLAIVDPLNNRRSAFTLTPTLREEMQHATRLVRGMLGETRYRAISTDAASTPLDALTADTLAWAESLRAVKSEVHADLSAREMEVLRLIAGGKSNRDIAEALVISTNTVARHVSNIFDKLGATNRTEAAAYAHRYGLTPSC